MAEKTKPDTLNKPETFLSEEEAKECEEEMNKGTENYLQYLKARADKWKSVPVTTAVIGESGVGKSSFINAIRDLKDTDEHAADVGGYDPTTTQSTEYKHPSHEMIAFWDIPGCGDLHVSVDTYLEDIHVDSYDCFLLLSATRFTESVMKLALDLKERKKNFYFIRTNIRKAVKTEIKKGDKPTVEEVLEAAKNSIKKDLGKEGLQCPIFLIDNKRRKEFEFEALRMRIIEDLPENKRESLVLSMKAMSKDMIDMKVKQLKKRAWGSAVASAAVAAIPFPGISVAFDMGLILAELNFYFHQFGLDSESLKQSAKAAGIDENCLKEIVSRMFPNQIGVQYVKTLVQSSTCLVIGTVVEEAARFVLFAGALITGPLSFATTRYTLGTGIDQMSETALQIINEMHSSSV